MRSVSSTAAFKRSGYWKESSRYSGCRSGGGRLSRAKVSTCAVGPSIAKSSRSRQHPSDKSDRNCFQLETFNVKDSAHYPVTIAAAMAQKNTKIGKKKLPARAGAKPRAAARN